MCNRTMAREGTLIVSFRPYPNTSVNLESIRTWHGAGIYNLILNEEELIIPTKALLDQVYQREP